MRQITRLATGIAFAMATTLPALPLWAGTTIADVDACMDTAAENGTLPTACVDNAHKECLEFPEDMQASAALCFTQAREMWTDGISAKLDDITATAPPQIAKIAGIEVKYDLLSALVQCDRMEELNGLREEATAEEILRQKTACTATASGLAYTKLAWRSRQLP
ncbi:hypothetical protein [Celeribacter sp.]|uniref:hypothetical protein n=1 Tax=Celeribacter sp. TaxID=1890673 RepID=UPI003A8E2A8F